MQEGHPRLFPPPQQWFSVDYAQKLRRWWLWRKQALLSRVGGLVMGIGFDCADYYDIVTDF
eukprot:721073-Prorocentrum_lima.AAC.1